ncbi:cholesterol transport system auxiliary component [Rhizobium sp. SG_E_25_P2]|jgi:cholesterol transport system auxiliary component|nr:cholesterol transport system auxiliary component [Rhizobium sp. SG_E_25_P2]
MLDGASMIRERSVIRLARAFFMGACLLALGGCLGGSPDDTFSLTAVRGVEGPKLTQRQILIPEPTAVKALDSEQVVIRVSQAEIQYLAKSRWSDRLPRLVQARLVQAFENTGRLGGVGMPGQGLAIDYQVITEIRAFEIQAYGGSRAQVEMSAKLLNDRNGEVRASRVFTASAPVSGSGNDAFITALDAAFGKVTTDLVGWTLKAM